MFQLSGLYFRGLGVQTLTAFKAPIGPKLLKLSQSGPGDGSADDGFGATSSGSGADPNEPGQLQDQGQGLSVEDLGLRVRDLLHTYIMLEGNILKCTRIRTLVYSTRYIKGGGP